MSKVVHNNQSTFMFYVVLILRHYTMKLHACEYCDQVVLAFQIMFTTIIVGSPDQLRESHLQLFNYIDILHYNIHQGRLYGPVNPVSYRLTLASNQQIFLGRGVFLQLNKACSLHSFPLPAFSRILTVSRILQANNACHHGDRLPKYRENTLEGLLIMMSSWRMHGIDKLSTITVWFNMEESTDTDQGQCKIQVREAKTETHTRRHKRGHTRRHTRRHARSQSVASI